jgi:hypothetical protein
MVLLSVQGMDVAGIAMGELHQRRPGREIIKSYNEDGFDSPYLKYVWPAAGVDPAHRHQIRASHRLPRKTHGLPISTWSLAKPGRVRGR